VRRARPSSFLDGKQIGKTLAYAAEDLRGAVGLVQQGGKVRFSELRVRY